MVRDVRDHTFSSLDCLWSLRKGFILPRETGQCELMTQRSGLDTNAIRVVVRACSWDFLAFFLKTINWMTVNSHPANWSVDFRQFCEIT